MEPTAQYHELINGFANKRILVVGDLILDAYLRGSSTRLCPEAPVPVVDIHKKVFSPGGAGNTVCNLRALGASVVFCTVVGDDREGDEAMRLLEDIGVCTEGIVRHPGRKTLTKSRVMAGSQLIARIDEGSADITDYETSGQLMAYVENSYHSFDAVVLSDYDKGVITPAVRDRLCQLQKSHQVFMAVDSKRLPFFSSLHPSYAKPNYTEAIKLLDLPPLAIGRAAQIGKHADQLLAKVNARLLSVTLDVEGSLVIANGHPLTHYSAPPVRNGEVAGAGDSYFSGFLLSYLCSGNPDISATIATVTASIAIEKEGTASCSQQELRSHFQVHSKYIATLPELAEICSAYRSSGKRIVFTNGCFDILHSGHVMYLRRAKELGDVLIVGLNTDDSIKRIKGSSRPINSLADRLQVLAGLTSVDHIVPFGDEHDDTPVALIGIVRPHVFAKGGDYSKKDLPEAPTVEACGGQIVFLDHVPDHSTTRIINRIARISNAPLNEPIFYDGDLERR